MADASEIDPRITEAAANIVDVWMGGRTEWRKTLHHDDFLESADWEMAMNLPQAAARAFPLRALDEMRLEAAEARVAVLEEALEKAARIVEAEVVGVECDRFSLDARVLRNLEGHDLFISSPRVSDLLRQRAASIRAARAAAGDRT